MNQFIDKIYKNLDTKTTFHVPNETSVEGRELVDSWSYDNKYPPLPSDWRWEWIIPKGTYCGTLPKRIAQYLYKEHHIKIPASDLAKLGTVLSEHTKGMKFTFDFTKTFDWKAGDFGDNGSCFWGDRNRAKDMILDLRGCAIRFWEYIDCKENYVGQDSDCNCDGCTKQRSEIKAKCISGEVFGYGRSWIIPHSEGIVLFNTYSYKKNRSTPSVDSLIVARLLSLYLGGSYKKIKLSANERTDGTLYINGGSAFMVASQQDLEFAANVDLRLKDNYDDSGTCSNCNRRSDDLLTDPEGENLCENCFYEVWFICEGCDGTYSRNDEHNSPRGQGYCEGCFYERFFICEDCSETFSAGHRSEDPEGKSLCDDCFNSEWFVCSECDRTLSTDSLNGPAIPPICNACAEKEEATQ